MAYRYVLILPYYQCVFLLSNLNCDNLYIKKKYLNRKWEY